MGASQVDHDVPRVVRIADRIEADIRRRRLQPGTRYRTAIEVARWLKTSNEVANRAMQLLAQRRVIERKQRIGAIIASPVIPTDAPLLTRVHLVVEQNYMRTEGLYGDGIVVGIQSALPDVAIQFDFVTGDDRTYMQRLVNTALASGEPVGFILVRSSLAAQRIMAESGLPAVIHGDPHPSVTTLPFLDQDLAEGGRLLTEYVLSQGARKLLVLRRQQILPGDFPLFDGIRKAAAKAGLGLDDFMLRDLPADEQAVAAAVDQVLADLDEPPAVVTVTERLANGAAAALTRRYGESMSRWIGVYQVYRRGNENPPPYAFMRPTWSPWQQGERLGQMLRDLADGGRPDPMAQRISVELVKPTT